MNQQDIDAFLEHHGVKGQKWGVRRNRKSNNSVSISRDHRTAQALRGRKVSSLSNKELRIANERANLQKNFRNLNPTAVQRGGAHVKSILTTLGVGTTAVSLVKFSKTPEGKELLDKASKWFQRPATKKIMESPLPRQLAFDI